MASYQGHLTLSSMLGAAYGAVGTLWLNLDWGEVFLGAGLTTLGGLLPDLDSDSSVPVRELFGVAAATTPVLLLGRLHELGYSTEQVIVILGGVYLLIRYGLSTVFKWLTVHRGMFHSVPAMLIAGLAVVLLYHSPDWGKRAYVAAGTMLGFLSHLVLDELYAVDIMGVKIRLNKYAGSALKFVSPSWPATGVCYALLVGLGYLAYVDWNSGR